ncbi:dihydrodipicolinate synthase family protein [Aestuariimicrobium soli]|uniref:dihydrodipicolinate synthase family protein n=1 Tax=Aestuariimicrobium soli TaxID=2035834 RepID=UPI003EB853C3
MVESGLARMKGVWAALPIPWQGEHVDQAMVRELVHRYADAGLHGAYTAGTDGELHVLDDRAFDELTEALAAASAETGLAVQAGCTASHTSAVVRRARFASDAGIRVVQVALPGWIPLSDDEVVDFFGGLAQEVPEVGVVHYNIATSGRFLLGAQYRRLVEACPTLVGTKTTGGDVSQLIDIVDGAPDLAHFVVDHQIVPGAQFGAVGFYSFHANLVPRVSLALWEACERRDWDEAVRLRLAMEVFLREWRAARPKVSSPALAKIATSAGLLPGFPLGVRAPYRSGSDEDVAALVELVGKHFGG